MKTFSMPLTEPEATTYNVHNNKHTFPNFVSITENSFVLNNYY